MNKKIVITGIVIILLISVLCGCISTESYEEKFIGKWKGENIPEGEEGSTIFNFYENGSYSISFTSYDADGNLTTDILWNTYEIKGETLILDMMDTYEVEIAEHLTYSFSNDNNTLTLTEENGTPTVLIRDLS